MCKFSAAIFDMDGLLLDSERVIMDAWLGVALELGVVVPPDRYLGIVGKTFDECRVVLSELLGSPCAFDEALNRVRTRLDPQRVSRAVFPLKPGVLELLHAMQEAGIPCAVASSSTTDEIESRLSRVGVRHVFSEIVGGNEVVRGKPDPAIYVLAAKRLGYAPEACIAFEDSTNGAHAAMSAGVPVVIVPDLVAPTEHTRRASVATLSRLDDAIQYLPTGSRSPPASYELGDAWAPVGIARLI